MVTTQNGVEVQRGYVPTPARMMAAAPPPGPTIKDQRKKKRGPPSANQRGNLANLTFQ